MLHPDNPREHSTAALLVPSSRCRDRQEALGNKFVLILQQRKQLHESSFKHSTGILVMKYLLDVLAKTESSSTASSGTLLSCHPS